MTSDVNQPVGVQPTDPSLLQEQEPKRARRSKVAARDARKAILEAAATLFYREPVESVSLDRLADHAGLHKMSIYRNYGSRAALVQAYAGWLCERERAHWREVAHRAGDEPVAYLRELFIDLARRMSSDSYRGCRLHLLARQFPDDTHPVRLTLAEHERAFHGLLRRLAAAAEVVDADGLADTLMLLWEGATLNLRSDSESRRVAQRLPTLADRTIRSYGCGT